MNQVFDRTIEDYHRADSVDGALDNPHPKGTLEALLCEKNWIDTVQWHLEDIIRRPDLAPDTLVGIKRRIDASNQARTDLVERIDDYFLEAFAGKAPGPTARLNTETPAWAADRLSILALKLFHMREQAERTDADQEHVNTCRMKLAILQEQRRDLTCSIDELLEDIASGRKVMKVYRQMKMYNDASLNPELYGGKTRQKPK